MRSFVIVAGISVMLFGTAARELDLSAFFPVSTLIKTLLFSVVIVVIFKDVLRRRQVDMDAVLGACCIYLLMGLAWESVYAVIEWQIPNSFALPTGSPASGSAPDVMSIQADLMYFSLITMTTIGYGDITPVSAPARVLSALQGVVAQLYVAIIIARLVGMELANRRSGPPQPR
jgi:multidrug transporter EmrE-like cation transporter